jgi:hypothetical protein
VVGTELSQLVSYPYGQTTWMKVLCSVPVAGLALASPLVTRRRELWPWVLLAFGPVLLEIGAGFFVTIFCGRGLIFVLGPILILAALSVGAIGGVRARVAAAGIVLLGAVPGLRFIHAALEKEDWRSAVAFLHREAAPGDLVMVHEGYLDVSLFYYLPDHRGLDVLDVEAGGLQGSFATLEEAALQAQERPRVWIVRRTYRERPEVPEFLAEDFPVREESRWRHVSVLQMSR